MFTLNRSQSINCTTNFEKRKVESVDSKTVACYEWGWHRSTTWVLWVVWKHDAWWWGVCREGCMVWWGTIQTEWYCKPPQLCVLVLWKSAHSSGKTRIFTTIYRVVWFVIPGFDWTILLRRHCYRCTVSRYTSDINFTCHPKAVWGRKLLPTRWRSTPLPSRCQDVPGWNSIWTM